MREIKFQFLYKGAPFHGGTEDFNWHKKVYSIDQIISTKLSNLCDIHNTSTLIAKRQFTGLKDKSGADIYEGDIYFDRGFSLAFGRKREYCNFRIVQFDSERTCFNAKTHCGTSVIDKNCIIEGNIYQNPELIENTNK